MLIPIAAGIAAAVSRALIPPIGFNLKATDRYLTDVDAHAKDFVERGTTFLHGVIAQPQQQRQQVDDGSAASENTDEKKKKKAAKVKRPPPLPDTDDPLILLGLESSPSSTLEEIKVAYKAKVKMYHPDRLGLDATSEEREKFGDYFKRINEAFELLKKREDDDPFIEYDMFENGERVTKSAYIDYDYEDPYHIDFDRIRRSNAESRKRMWYHDEYYYGPPIESHQSQRERWWQQRENDYIYEYDDVNNRRGYYGSPGDYARRQGYNHRPEGMEYNREYGANNDSYRPSFERRESYHKQRSWIDDQFNEARFSDDQYDYYQSREGYDRFRDKWWTRGYDEYGFNLNGEFGP